MRLRKSEINARVNNNLRIKFIRNDLSSYSGLELIKRFFRAIGLNERIRGKMSQLGYKGGYPCYKMALIIITGIIIGVERLSNIEYIKNDPLVKRMCELSIMPSRFTIVRFLKQFSGELLNSLVELNSELLMAEIKRLKLNKLTIDVDGTVISSRGEPEMSAKGYNPIKRGANSYFPITAYLAQTGHFLKTENRPGNVHDSNGSYEFIEELLRELRYELGDIRLQIRHDSAFFSEKMLKMYEDNEVEYSVKVPFERYAGLKNVITSRVKWERINRHISYFYKTMKMDRWEEERIFLFIRTSVLKKEKKNECQLDLFKPDDMNYKYSVICTNMNLSAKNIFNFMSGRSAQEKAIGELKSDFSFDKIPSDSFAANCAFQQLSMLAYNLMTTFQLEVCGFKNSRLTSSVSRIFKYLRFKTIRFLIIYKAGIITNADGRKNLCLTKNDASKNLFNKIMKNVDLAA